jgi:hypothetical protein
MPQNKLKTMLSIIRSLFTPSPAPTFQELAAGTCVLPAPKAAVKVPSIPETPDVYVINKDTATFGFNKATATFQADGAIGELTEFDVELLMERGYWGQKKVQQNNAKAKRLWFKGETNVAIALAVERDISWVEKRVGTFSTALSLEKSKNGAI